MKTKFSPQAGFARWVCLLFALAFPGFTCLPASAAEAGPRWWKGNLHTHTLWSDGDDYPEMVSDWYREHGYHFLVLSDHNILQEGVRWRAVTRTPTGERGLKRYQERFGEDWVRLQTVGGTQMVRLKTLTEFRHRFEEPNRFLFMVGEEVTDHFQNIPLHFIGTNLRELIRPPGGTNILDVMQRNVDAILAQRARTGQAMLPHIAHPNYGWAITAEDLMRVKSDRHFEVYNGHPGVDNFGDRRHASVERMWDIVLTRRLAELKLGVMFGVAVDDAHHYTTNDLRFACPGRGWVMVRASELKPEAIIAALEAGDFYASSGVRLKRLQREGQEISLEIEPEEGVSYITKFIGTRAGYDPRSEPVLDLEGQPLRVTQTYSRDIGTVLKSVSGTSASYRLEGDEIYVRAKVVSTKFKANPSITGELEAAWIQPLVPAGK